MVEHEVFEVDGIIYDVGVYRINMGNYTPNVQPMFQLKDDHFDACEHLEDIGQNCGHGSLMRFSELSEATWYAFGYAARLDEWEIL